MYHIDTYLEIKWIRLYGYINQLTSLQVYYDGRWCARLHPFWADQRKKEELVHENQPGVHTSYVSMHKPESWQHPLAKIKLYQHRHLSYLKALVITSSQLAVIHPRYNKQCWRCQHVHYLRSGVCLTWFKQEKDTFHCTCWELCLNKGGEEYTYLWMMKWWICYDYKNWTTAGAGGLTCGWWYWSGGGKCVDLHRLLLLLLLCG